MRVTKSFYYLSVSLLLTILLSIGCSSSDSNPTGDNNALVGTWDLTTVTINMQGQSIPIAAADLQTWLVMFPDLAVLPATIVLNADGTFQVTYAGGGTETGTWTSTNTTISTTAQGDTAAEELPYTLSGNTATITITENDPELGTITISILYTKR